MKGETALRAHSGLMSVTTKLGQGQRKAMAVTKMKRVYLPMRMTTCIAVIFHPAGAAPVNSPMVIQSLHIEISSYI